MRSIRMSTRKVMKIRDRIYGRNMTLIGFVQLDSKQQFFFLSFFDTTRHKETWAGLAVKPWGFYKLCMCNFKGKHTRARKHQHHHDFFKRFHLLNSRLFGLGSFYEQNRQHFFL
jgi:hypothetical protein